MPDLKKKITRYGSKKGAKLNKSPTTVKIFLYFKVKGKGAVKNLDPISKNFKAKGSYFF